MAAYLADHASVVKDLLRHGRNYEPLKVRKRSVVEML